ncbi:MAG: twin-arginine translocase subunit TatC [Patescibacteria group bacterium]
MTSLQHHEAKSVLEHVGELRKKLLIALGAFIVGAIIAHIFNKEIIDFLLKPAGSQSLIFLSPLEPFFFVFKIDFIAGIIIAFPFIVWCLFSYITPALSKRATTLLFSFYITSTLLLFAGLFYAFFITIPFSLKFLFSITIPGIENNFSVERYLSFFVSQALIITAVFQVPILVIGGIYLGVFKTKLLAAKRRYIYLILIIALAVFTPTADIFNLGIVFIPCIVIFEISLIGGKIVEFLKKKKEKNLKSVDVSRIE